MPKKKHKNYLALGIIYLFKGIYWLVKNIFLGIWWILKFLYLEIKLLFSKDKTKVKEEIKKEKLPETHSEKVLENTPAARGQRKIAAIYQPFEILKDIKGTYSDFESKLFSNSSTIGIILGARGTGKSAIGLKLLENIHAKTGKKVYTMGFKTEDLPHWILNIDSLDDVQNNAVVLLDESGIQFSSRESMSNVNKLLSKLLLIARHKDLNLLFITQNSSNIDLNIIRQADYLLLKHSSLLQKDFERKKINDIYTEAEKHFKEYKDQKGLTYIYSDSYKGFITNPLPSFWTSNVSKAYRK